VEIKIMPKFLAPIDFEVWCTCGEGLCLKSEGVDEGKRVWKEGYHIGPAIVVEPCPKCRKKVTHKKERE
jgi:hypothetical protein